MSTSGTYTFQSLESIQLIECAYKMAGVPFGNITPTSSSLVREQITDAQRAINFILQAWPNQGKNLWTLRSGLISLNPSQATYSVPDNAIELKTVALRNSTRYLSGTASASEGNAANVFNSASTAGCIQTAQNGYIEYQWESDRTIQLVGITSNVNRTYTIDCLYSSDGATWSNAIAIESQAYVTGETKWFNVSVPQSATYFRIEEAGGAVLNIRQLYFNGNVYDSIMGELSESEYNAITQKTQAGPPNSFWFNRQIAPELNVWPIPTSDYTTIFCTYTKSLQDAGAMVNTLEVPSRFAMPLRDALAYELAEYNFKTVPGDKIQRLKINADTSFLLATTNDRERVPLRINPQRGWV